MIKVNLTSQSPKKELKKIYIDPRIAFRICFQFFIPFVIDFESVSREMTLRVGHINEVYLRGGLSNDWTFRSLS